jgi:hypothetical protein
MDKETVDLIIKLASLSSGASKAKALNAKMSEIKSTIDDLVLREIKSAYDCIQDAIDTDNNKTREARFRAAEDNLLKNTRLSPERSTGRYSNTYLIALSHFGLAVICALRGDQKISARHILNLYTSEPRLARNKIAPDVYQELFLPKCSDLLRLHQQQIDELAHQTSTIKEFGQKAAAAGLIVGGFAVFLATKSHTALREAGKNGEKMWNSAKYDISYEERERRTKKVKEELESALDKRCQELALELL